MSITLFMVEPVYVVHIIYGYIIINVLSCNLNMLKLIVEYFLVLSEQLFNYYAIHYHSYVHVLSSQLFCYNSNLFVISLKNFVVLQLMPFLSMYSNTME